VGRFWPSPSFWEIRLCGFPEAKRWDRNLSHSENRAAGLCRTNFPALRRQNGAGKTAAKPGTAARKFAVDLRTKRILSESVLSSE